MKQFQATGRQRGASLVEALVALLVMGFGMMAVAGIQGRLRNSGDVAKQRAEASRIASAEMERLRSYGGMVRTDTTPAGVVTLDEITDKTVTVHGASTDYKLERTVANLAEGGLEIHLKVSWADRTQNDEDTPMSLDWKTALAAEDPRLTASAFVPPDYGVAQRRSRNRHVAIPGGAKNLDAARSVFKPVPNGVAALVFNNQTGMILQRCTVDAAVSTAALTDAHLNACVSYASGAYLLSGNVSYSMGASPDSEYPLDAVIPGLGVQVTLSSAVHPSVPECFTDASANALAGVSATSYYCVIEPRQPTAGDTGAYWSGVSTLTGLNLAAGGQRVCRYSDDYNGNGSVENAEHPASYSKVAESLAHQNFLVIANAANCPAGHAVDLPHQVYRNTVTVRHQG